MASASRERPFSVRLNWTIEDPEISECHRMLASFFPISFCRRGEQNMDNNFQTELTKSPLYVLKRMNDIGRDDRLGLLNIAAINISVVAD